MFKTYFSKNEEVLLSPLKTFLPLPYKKDIQEVKVQEVKVQPDKPQNISIKDSFIYKAEIAFGFDEGFAKGKSEGLRQIINNMLKNECTLSLISKATGLFVKEIKKLKNGSGNHTDPV